jgi:hypothetical protein
MVARTLRASQEEEKREVRVSAVRAAIPLVGLQAD